MTNYYLPVELHRELLTGLFIFKIQTKHVFSSVYKEIMTQYTWSRANGCGTPEDTGPRSISLVQVIEMPINYEFNFFRCLLLQIIYECSRNWLFLSLCFLDLKDSVIILIRMCVGGVSGEAEINREETFLDTLRSIIFTQMTTSVSGSDHKTMSNQVLHTTLSKQVLCLCYSFGCK